MLHHVGPGACLPRNQHPGHVIERARWPPIPPCAAPRVAAAARQPERCCCALGPLGLVATPLTPACALLVVSVFSHRVSGPLAVLFQGRRALVSACGASFKKLVTIRASLSVPKPSCLHTVNLSPCRCIVVLHSSVYLIQCTHTSTFNTSLRPLGTCSRERHSPSSYPSEPGCPPDLLLVSRCAARDQGNEPITKVYTGVFGEAHVWGANGPTRHDQGGAGTPGDCL